jgi:hypothetical protein
MKRKLRYHFSCVEFSGPLPIVWCHPESRSFGADDGIKVVFSSKAEMKELVNTLQGALNAMKRSRLDKSTGKR